MKVAISLGAPYADDIKEIHLENQMTYVVEAERLGAESAWSAEAWGYDAITPRAYLAARTSRIRLGTGIMQIGARTPAMIAMTALTMATLSQDRFILGLGVSGPQVMEGWHGVRFARPLQRTREVIDIVRMIARGERLNYHGEMYQLPLPGGEGKSFIPEHAHIFLHSLERGARKVGRSLADLDVQVQAGSVAFSDAVEHLIPSLKVPLAFYLGAIGSRKHNFYNEVFQRAGYKDLALQVQALCLQGQRKAASVVIPDELVLKTNLVGTKEMMRERLRVHQRAGVTTLSVFPTGQTLDARLNTLGQLLDLVKEVNAENGQVYRV